MTTALLITCEHASREIPAAFTKLFSGHQQLLATHRGYDIGAAAIYQQLVDHFKCPHFHGEWSRLVCDLNRTAKHKTCLSEITKTLPLDAQQAIIQEYHHPYQLRVIEQVDAMQRKADHVLHIAIHSFTPELHGNVRNADIGFLYDPNHAKEKQFCVVWREALNKIAPDLRIRMNYPYLGISDGLCPILRKKFGDRYSGIELEMNQALTGVEHTNQRLQELILKSLQQSLSLGWDVVC